MQEGGPRVQPRLQRRVRRTASESARWRSVAAFDTAKPARISGRHDSVATSLCAPGASCGASSSKARAPSVWSTNARARRSIERAAREVILSAGTLSSPKVLMVSGVGPRAHLEEHGVDVVADVPGVGENLQEHPMCPMIFNVNVPTINMDVTVKGFVKHGWEYLVHGTGPPRRGVCHVLLFLKAGGDGKRPTVEAGFAPLGMVGADAGDTGQGGARLGRSTRRREHAAHGSAHVHGDRADGPPAVRAAGSSCDRRNRQTLPVIRHTLLGSAGRRPRTHRGPRAVREVMASEPLSSYVVSEALPGVPPSRLTSSSRAS